MATTRLIPMHKIKNQSIAYTVHERIKYAINPAKTLGGELVMTYGCDPATAANEMLLTKRAYADHTGREIPDSDVLLYQIRQSFKPGEVTPEQAQQIGYELAMSWTKGKHQFVVATHIDHAHIHTHIIYNATKIDARHKYRNFLGSSFALRRASDRLCLENGLSVVENPKPSRTHYGKWLGDKKKLSFQDKLRLAIDAALAEKPKDYDAFLKLMKKAGYEYKDGKQPGFRGPGQKKFTRLRSLKDGYSQGDILSIIVGKKELSPARKEAKKIQAQRVNLLVDIQAKLAEGKGAGYARWAQSFNLKQMASTLNFLTERKLLDYGTLCKKTDEVTARFHELSNQIKAAETRMAEIAVMKSISSTTPRPARSMWLTGKPVTPRSFWQNMNPTFCCIRLRKRLLMKWGSKSYLPSRASRPSMRSCWQKRKSSIPNTPAHGRRCGICRWQKPMLPG